MGLIRHTCKVEYLTNCSHFLSRMASKSTFPPAVMRAPTFLCSCQLGIILLLLFAGPMDIKLYPIIVLFYIFNTNVFLIMFLFICWLLGLIFCKLTIFFVYSLLGCLSFPCYYKNLFSVPNIANTFSKSVMSLLTLSMTPFVAQKSLIFTRLNSVFGFTFYISGQRALLK